MKNSITSGLAASVSILLLSCNQDAAAASFIALGDLAGGSFTSHATAISADGSTIVGYSDNADGTEAFRWTRAGGMQALGVLSGAPATDHKSYGSAVSADGSVIAGYGSSGSGTQAFRWTQAGGMVGSGGLGANDGFTRADAISADGSTIVGYSQTSAFSMGAGYRWTQGSGMVDMGKLPGDVWAWARGISADGSIIVGQSNLLSGGQAYRWTAAGGMQGLGKPSNFTNTSAGSVSNDGTVIGGSGQTGGKSRALIWTAAGGWENLGTLASYQNSSEEGMTADGSMLFGQVFNFDQATLTFTSEGMVWDRTHGMRFAKDWLANDYGLDLGLWQLSNVTGISGDGRMVVGFGINPDGKTEAWAVDLNVAAVPLPPGMWLLGSGLVALGGMRRRAHSK